jgi:hypothetical protein
MNMQGGNYKKTLEGSMNEICKNGYNETFRPYFDNLQSAQTPKVAWKTCPYPANKYELKNFRFEDYGSLLPPYLPGSERWQLQIRYAREGEVYGGFNMYVTMRNKQSLLAG